eukprot:GGOE01021687.1.p1 GENE.GGOE01021687.1~~GGOE01021687.1.p1  ORF type:complete len:503 (+),score=176.25 GGOE01021687.1:23-1510(+)
MDTFLSFLDYVSRSEQRRYHILLDCGPALHGASCGQALGVVHALLPSVFACSPNGAALTVFAESYISTGLQPNEAAAKEALQNMTDVFAGAGSSSLGEALQAALEEHFAGERQPTSILVVTAGDITDGSDVSLHIAGAVHRMKLYYELSISFLQVANSTAGSLFLQQLRDQIQAECRWPIVDVLPLDALPGGVAGMEAYLKRYTAHHEWGAEGSEEAAHRMAAWGHATQPRRVSVTGNFHGRRSSSLSTPSLQQVNLKFYNALAQRKRKEYGVLLDCSEGMNLADFNVARHILARTLASVYELDEDGITVWITKGANTIGTGYITTGEKLDDVFWEHQPGGATRLSSGLRNTFVDYFTDTAQQGKAMALLVVAATPPVDWYDCTDLLVKAAVDDASRRGLTVSFLNVGTGADWSSQLADEVNVRASRAFLDAYQIPMGAANPKASLARRVTASMLEDTDVVEDYVADFFPETVTGGAHFNIHSSKEFYEHVRGRR